MKKKHNTAKKRKALIRTITLTRDPDDGGFFGEYGSSGRFICSEAVNEMLGRQEDSEEVSKIKITLSNRWSERTPKEVAVVFGDRIATRYKVYALSYHQKVLIHKLGFKGVFYVGIEEL